jgi:hypothetical protein
MPLGFFDDDALPLGWFDESADPTGWFDFDFADLEEAGGEGGGGGTPGPGGGPGTYTIPAGLTTTQKKALAALLACAPCCGSGSGSGSTGINYIPCSILESIGGSTVTLDYVVSACSGSSASVPWTSAACGPSCLFSTSTDSIISAGDTSFDPTDVPGPIIIFQWCDGENTYWVSSATEIGTIQFAFCCVTRSDSSTYMALYALLSLVCYDPNPPFAEIGQANFAYKTRDLAYVPGDPFVVSLTGLTPFSTAYSGTGCCVDLPALSIALTVDTP